MLSVDLHTHSTFSLCGNNTLLEMLQFAIKKGLKGLAITDHGPGAGAKVPVTFYERFENPYSEIRLFKGMECNLKGKAGDLDLPNRFLRDIDIVLLGLHLNCDCPLDIEGNTDKLILAMEKNPHLDIITHPNDRDFEIDFVKLARSAKKHGVALELNNSKLKYNRIEVETAESLLEACLQEECLIAVNSDAHAVMEIGDDRFTEPLLKKYNFPIDRIINHSLDSSLKFIDSRRDRKRA